MGSCSRDVPWSLTTVISSSFSWAQLLLTHSTCQCQRSARGVVGLGSPLGLAKHKSLPSRESRCRREHEPTALQTFCVKLIKFLVREMRLLSCFCLWFPELKTWCVTCAWSGGAGAPGSHRAECSCAGLGWELVHACLGLWAELPAQQLVGTWGQSYRHKDLNLHSSKGEKGWGAEKQSKCKLSRRRKALTLILSFTG